jgi:hypothetical protein
VIFLWPPTLSLSWPRSPQQANNFRPTKRRAGRRPLFTRVDAGTFNYGFTVEDPANEYACREDNYDMVHFLKWVRSREKKGETE